MQTPLWPPQPPTWPALYSPPSICRCLTALHAHDSISTCHHHALVRGSSYDAGRHQRCTGHLGAGHHFAGGTIRADIAGRVGSLKGCCAMMPGGAAGDEGF